MNPPDMNSRSLTPLTPPRLLSRRCSVAKGADVYIKRKVFLDLSIHYLVEGNVHLEKSRRDEVDSFLRREPLLLAKIPIDAFFTLHQLEDAPLHGSFVHSPPS